MGKQKITIRNKRKIKVENYENEYVNNKSEVKKQVSKAFTRETKFTILSIFIITIVMISSAYAIFSTVQKQEDYNTLTVGTLKIDFDASSTDMGNIINLNGAYPVSDADGQKTNPYTFRITNSGTLAAAYKIKIIDDQDIINEDKCQDNLLAKENVKVSINGETPFLLNSVETAEYVIDSNTLNSGATKNFAIRIWIDENSGNEVLGKHYHGKIVVESANTKEKEETELSFTDDSWATISSNVKAGKGNLYKVGDTKTVEMGEFGIHTVRLSNTSDCTNGETSETACGFVVEFSDIITEHVMNSAQTNIGGWPVSEMRTYINGDIYNALPSDLQNTIAATTVISSHSKTSGETNFTSSDKLYLLSTKEVWGKDGTSNTINYDTSEAETRQLDYYKNNGVTTANYSGAIKQYNGSNYYWWLRGAISSNASDFFIVNSSAAWGNYRANSTYGVSPAFRIS